MKVLLWLLIFVVFFAKAVVFIDPDFGQHLATGQLILRSGIPSLDPFSYTMPNFPYVDHSWLSDVIIATFFSKICYPGLAVLFSLIALAALFFSAAIVKSKSGFGWPVLIVTAATLVSFVAIRPILFTWLFFAFLVWVTAEKSRFHRWRYFLPPLFVLWANLHGGFAVGLFVIALQGDLVVLFLCLLATLLNPYGLSLWREVFFTVSDRSLFFSIQEWMPTFFRFDPGFALLLVLATGGIVRYFSRFRLRDVILFASVLLLALSSNRHLPLWLLVALPVVLAVGNFFYQSIASSPERLTRFRLALKFFSVAVTTLSVLELIMTARGTLIYNETNFYPGKAVAYLRQNLPSGEIISSYGWGGYLLWKLPEKKVFVDGRMPSWRQDGYSAFRQSQQIASGEVDFQPVFSKYHVTTILWPVTDTNFLTRLTQAGWKQVYKDQAAVVDVLK